MMIGIGGVVGGLIGCSCGVATGFAWYFGLGNEIVDQRAHASVVESVAVGLTVAMALTATGVLSGWLLSRAVLVIGRLWGWGCSYFE
jgi:hypothetical protein